MMLGLESSSDVDSFEAPPAVVPGDPSEPGLSPIGPYVPLELVGQGGMGVVYRARDDRLGRDVALKLLPEAFASDQQRIERFQREARVLASLNHPNIATVHGLEQSTSVRALVMELVEGPTLAERIAQGPIPLGESLPIAKQIAEALEYAHEHGIIHRDLKAANIKLTPDGNVKVLDFGLAKALGDDPSGQDTSNPPTLRVATTQAGAILGTAAYMSPEQAKGKSVDRRTDIWAFGCVFYELLSGKRAFPEEGTLDTLAGVIGGEPDWNALPAGTPQRVRELVKRCLTKDPRQRLQAIGEARISIEQVVQNGPAAGEMAARGVVSWHRAVPWVLAGILAIVSTYSLWRQEERAAQPVAGLGARAQIVLPSEAPVWLLPGQPSFALSPDGMQFVHVGGNHKGTRLYRRSRDEFEAAPLAQTEGAVGPFFSPDGQWLGFFLEGKLKTMPIRGGGAPTVLCDVGNPQGASWGPDDTIILNRHHGEGLIQIPASGGTPRPLTSVDFGRGEAGHHWPYLLPGGKELLFTIEVDGKPYDEALVVVQSLETGERHTLVRGTDGRYVPTGHLVYSRNGDLLAVPFRPEKGAVVGTPTVVVRDVMMSIGNGYAHYSFSQDGTLVYLTGRDPRHERRLLVVDRNGKSQPIPGPRAFDAPRISPDGRRLVAGIRSANDDLWVYDFERGTLTRITTERENMAGVWAPDGKRLAFASHGAGAPNLFWIAADGSGTAQQLLTSDRAQWPSSWSPDGRWLAFTELDPVTGFDILLLPMDGDHKPTVFLKTRFVEVLESPQPGRPGRGNGRLGLRSRRAA